MVSHGTISDEYHWKNAGLTVVVNRKFTLCLCANEKMYSCKKGEGFSGVSRLYIDWQSSDHQKRYHGGVLEGKCFAGIWCT